MANTLKIEPWLDYHRDPILFFVIDEDGCKVRCFPSEAEAMAWVLAQENPPTVEFPSEEDD